MDTTIGGANRAFPSTRRSLIAVARDRTSPAHRQAMEEFCRLYWKPIYAYIRASRAYDNEKSKDLTQEFLVHLIDGDMLDRFTSGDGGFRAFLRGAVKLFLLEDHRDASRLKRSAGPAIQAADGDELRRVEDLADRTGGTPEEAFDRQWAHSIVDRSIADVKKELEEAGKGVCFQVLDRYELNPPAGEAPSYESIAKELGINPSEVSVHLAACRRLLRRRVEELVREYVDSEETVAAEIARLFSR